MRILLSLFLGILVLVPSVFADSVAERRAELERTLDRLEEEIGAQEDLVNSKRTERVSLERDVAILDAQIKKAQLQIEARTLAIRGLTTDIVGKEETIDSLTAKLGREKDSLAQLLRKTSKIDDYSYIEVLLAKEDISEFFSDLSTFDDVQAALYISFDEIEDTQVETAQEKEVLTSRRAEEIELRNLQELERQQIEVLQDEKEVLLRETQGQENLYQALLNSKRRSAAQIRAELFSLRDSAAIPFGEALELAQQSEAGTGVRAELILGVLKQETKLGEFLGTGNWLVDMHPTRDRPVFPYVADAAGFNKDEVPVSKAPGYGWGGAMGPSQFIPSTWVCYGGLINTRTNDCNNATRSMSWDEFWQGPWEYRANKDRIRAAIGGTDPSNPYVNEDAFTATALLLLDNGGTGSRYNERMAALRYFAGWTNASKPQYAFYGDSVMEHADYFAEQIRILGE